MTQVSWAASAAQIRKIQWRQITVLATATGLIGLGMAFWIPPVGYPYLGFAIAAAGISIAIQQLYIYSLVDTIVLLDRKSFYLAASVTLLVLGGAQGAYCLHLITDGANGYGSTKPGYVDTLRHVGEVAALYGLLWVLNLLVAFLYADTATSSTQPDETGWRALLLPLLGGQLEAARLSERLPPGLRNISQWLRLATLFGFHGTWMLTIAMKLVPIESVWVMERPRNFLALATSVTALVCGTLYVIHRVADVTRGRSPSRGFSAFLSFVLLAAGPPVLQAAFEVARFSYGSGAMWAVTASIVALLAGAFLYIAYRIRAYAGAPAPVLGGAAPAAGTGRNPLELIGLGVPAVVLLAFAALYPLANDGGKPSVPQAIFSFGFFVLGCAYVTANDLSSASDSYKTIARDFFSGQFLTTVHHELVNPLQPALNFLRSTDLRTTLETPRPEPELEEARQRAFGRLGYSADGVERSLRFLHRMRSEGTIVNEPDTVSDLIPYVRNFVEGYRASVLAERPGITLDVFPGATTVMARFKPLLFTSALRMLIDNAVEASESGRSNEILVQASYEHQRKAVVISIKDTGCGMSPERKALFGHPQTSSKPTGSGIGTTTAKRFFEAMGGRLNLAYSDPNVGTGVEILLQPS